MSCALASLILTGQHACRKPALPGSCAVVPWLQLNTLCPPYINRLQRAGNVQCGAWHGGCFGGGHAGDAPDGEVDAGHSREEEDDVVDHEGERVPKGFKGAGMLHLDGHVPARGCGPVQAAHRARHHACDTGPDLGAAGAQSYVE